mgnify:CR=1 FL=1
MKAAEEVYDSMGWAWAPTPTQTSVTQVKVARASSEPVSYQLDDHYLRGKRARWASDEEVDKRRRKGLCLRCARSGCRFLTCPLSSHVVPRCSHDGSMLLVPRSAPERLAVRHRKVPESRRLSERTHPPNKMNLPRRYRSQSQKRVAPVLSREQK